MAALLHQVRRREGRREGVERKTKNARRRVKGRREGGKEGENAAPYHTLIYHHTNRMLAIPALAGVALFAYQQFTGKEDSQVREGGREGREQIEREGEYFAMTYF